MFNENYEEIEKMKLRVLSSMIKLQYLGQVKKETVEKVFDEFVGKGLMKDE